MAGRLLASFGQRSLPSCFLKALCWVGKPFAGEKAKKLSGCTTPTKVVPRIVIRPWALW